MGYVWLQGWVMEPLEFESAGVSPAHLEEVGFHSEDEGEL